MFSSGGNPTFPIETRQMTTPNPADPLALHYTLLENGQTDVLCENMQSYPPYSIDLPSVAIPDRQPARTCELCRRRKVKCDRNSPCGNCLRSKARCVPCAALRIPRGRHGGRKSTKNDKELLERLAKLEGLVADVERTEGIVRAREKVAIDDVKSHGTNGDDHSSAVFPQSRNHLVEGTGAAHSRYGSRSHNEAFIERHAPSEGLDQYIGASFWGALSDEIHGLQAILSSTSDDEQEGEDEQTSALDAPSSQQMPQKQLIYSDFVITPKMMPQVNYPTPHQSYTFCEVYLTNVDPVFKVLHAPSLRKYMQEGATHLDCSSGFNGLQALKFSIYYAATMSMADWECQARIGEEKAILLSRYRAGTESALANADFVNTVDMSTLQALTIYLVSVRAHDNSRLMWTLTSVAIRIAQAMGLQSESSFIRHKPFEREMRRRLWWQLCVLDSHAAEDRATHPVVSAESFDTRLPLRVNDEDLCHDSTEGVTEREGFTDMTFCLICQEVFGVMRKLNYVPAGQLGHHQNAHHEIWKHRVNMVIDLQARLEERYLRHLDLARPFHWAARMVADVIVAIMWLVVYRPLERGAKSTLPPQAADPGVLDLAVQVLEKAHQLYTDPAATPFRWLSQTYVQWHPLAVAIAELCIKTEGPMVERAWRIVEFFFRESGQHVADSHTGLLWRPIKKLMARARKIRKQHLQSQSTQQDNLGSPRGPTGFREMDPMVVANTEGEILNRDNFIQSDPNFAGSSVEGLQTAVSTSAPLPLEWDPWLASARATTTMDMASNEPDDHPAQTAWTNWEAFIDDVQGHRYFSEDLSGPASAYQNVWK